MRGAARKAARSPVSPGFTPRPSLSDAAVAEEQDLAGIVSPGFTPRPSLSGVLPGGRRLVDEVSPGFTPRPSLSEDGWPMSPTRCLIVGFGEQWNGKYG